MIKIIVLFIGAIILSCATPIFEKNNLANQILRVRVDYPESLTNSTCYEYKSGMCIKFNVDQYDLNDQKIREKLNSFNFKCAIAGKRYRICKDKPGYCRWIEECKKHSFMWWGCREWEEEYIPAKDHKYLIDAGVRCKRN